MKVIKINEEITENDLKGLEIDILFLFIENINLKFNFQLCIAGGYLRFIKRFLLQKGYTDGFQSIYRHNFAIFQYKKYQEKWSFHPTSPP